MINTYTFRSITPADQAFLLDLYSTTRKDIEQAVGLSAQQKKLFLTMQFDAQHKHYQSVFSDGTFNVILDANKNPIGRLYLHETEKEVLVVDIALLPSNQKMGIGSAILNNIMAKAMTAKLPVRLHVANDNPAYHWYKKLGFIPIKQNDMNYHMEWTGESAMNTVQQLNAVGS